MNPLQFLWKKPTDVDACPTKEMNLLVKLFETCSAFMVDKSVRN